MYTKCAGKMVTTEPGMFIESSVMHATLFIEAPKIGHKQTIYCVKVQLVVYLEYICL